jgi:hypothetical protein
MRDAAAADPALRGVAERIAIGFAGRVSRGTESS